MLQTLGGDVSTLWFFHRLLKIAIWFGDSPIKILWFFQSYVSLPQGITGDGLQDELMIPLEMGLKQLQVMGHFSLGHGVLKLLKKPSVLSCMKLSMNFMLDVNCFFLFFCWIFCWYLSWWFVGDSPDLQIGELTWTNPPCWNLLLGLPDNVEASCILICSNWNTG